jgi:hypothetical protein
MQHFPYVWIVSEFKYNMDFTPLRLFQTKNADEFVNAYLKKN